LRVVVLRKLQCLDRPVNRVSLTLFPTHLRVRALQVAHPLFRYFVTQFRFFRARRGVPDSADFFVVPTITFRLLFVFVILSHDRRRPVHLAVTANPTAEWTSRQLLEAHGD
jgi:hypothetical protein